MDNIFLLKVIVTLTFDPKFNRGNLVTKTNTHVKFEGRGPKRSLIIERIRFSYWRSLWLWPLTPKSIGVISWPKPIHMLSLRARGLSVLKLLSRQDFSIEGHCDLDLRPLTPKSIEVINWPRPIYMWSLRAGGPNILKLLSGQDFPIEGHCDFDPWPQNQ